MGSPDDPATAVDPALQVKPPEGMIRIPGGTFRMGSDDFYPEERGVHQVSREARCWSSHA